MCLMSIIINCKGVVQRLQSSIIALLLTVASKFMGKWPGLPSISNFHSAAIYPCHLELACYYLVYFKDLITFFIHREVRFIYWRSIKASIIATLLIRNTLHVDRQPTLLDLLRRYAFWGNSENLLPVQSSLLSLSLPGHPSLAHSAQRYYSLYLASNAHLLCSWEHLGHLL